MQSLISQQLKSSEAHLHKNLETQQFIHQANLERYEKIYKQYQTHLKQDLQRQKAELQNSEIVESMLKKIKKQIYDQLKHLESLESQGEDEKRQIGNQNQEIIKKKERQESEKSIDHKIFSNKGHLEPNLLISHQRFLQQTDSKFFIQEFTQLQLEVEKFKKFYSQINQRLNQGLTLFGLNNYQERISKNQHFQSQILKSKLQILINQNKRSSEVIKELQFQLKTYQYLKKNQRSVEIDQKSRKKSVSDVQQIKRLSQQLNKGKRESLQRQKIDSYQRKQLELKLLLKHKQIQEYKHQIQEMHQKLRISQSQIAKLQVEIKQLKEVRDESNLLKIRLFGLQNMHNIQKELPLVSSNIPQLIRSQIFNKKPKSISKENSKINKYPAKQRQSIHQQQQQKHLKQDMIRQNLASSLKHYKKKYSELEKKIHQKDQELQDFAEKSKQKINDYNTLIQKLHNQLEKSYLDNIERSQKSGLAQIYRNFQQKIDAVSTKNTQINRQIAEKQQIFNKQKEKIENQKKQLLQQFERISKENNQLKKINRECKNQLLQQKLSLDVWKSQNNNNNNSEKTKSLIFSLNQQVTLLRSQLQEKNDLLLKQESKAERLNQLNASLSASFEQSKREIQQLRQKNLQIQSKLYESSNKYSQQLENAKEKLELQQFQSQNLQKKLKYYINETKEYQARVKELQEHLSGLAQQNQGKNLEIFRINQENEQLVSRIQKLEQQFDMFQSRGSSLKKIQFINRSSELQSEIQSLKRKYSQSLHSLNLKQHQIQHLRSQCDRYIEQNLRYLKFIKEKGIEISESFLKNESQLEQEKTNKIKHLQQKNYNLTQDNELLKNLIEQMRSKLVEKTNPSAAILTSKHQDEIYELRNALANAQKLIENYKIQIQELEDKCNKEKSIFKEQWNRLIAEYNQRSRSQKSSQQNLGQSGKMQKRSSIQQSQGHRQLKKEIQRNQQQIKALKNQLQVAHSKLKQNKDEDNFDSQRVPEYFRQLMTLRYELQKVNHQKFLIQDKLRDLEQQNSSLKVRLISSNRYQSHQRLSQPRNLGNSDLMHKQSNASLKSAELDQKVLSSLKTEQRESQKPKQAKTDLFSNLASLAPLVESLKGQESFARLSNESKLSK